MRVSVLILMVLLAQKVYAQLPDSLRLVHRFPVAADAQIDNLGNIYLISADGQLKKLGPGGDSVAVFNQVRRNGKLHSVDVSNPLRLVLFYKDFAQMVVLDRLLGQQFSLDLRRSGILQPLALSASFDNRFWVFDALSGKLKKLDDKGSLLMETPDLRTVFPAGLQPQQIIDHNNWVYLYDPAQGLFVFDYFGNFKRKMPIQGWSNLMVTGQFVYGTLDGQLHSYAISTLMQTQKPLPEAIRACSGIRLERNKVVAICAGGVQVFGY